MKRHISQQKVSEEEGELNDIDNKLDAKCIVEQKGKLCPDITSSSIMEMEIEYLKGEVNLLKKKLNENNDELKKNLCDNSDELKKKINETSDELKRKLNESSDTTSKKLVQLETKVEKQSKDLNSSMHSIQDLVQNLVTHMKEEKKIFREVLENCVRPLRSDESYRATAQSHYGQVIASKSTQESYKGFKDLDKMLIPYSENHSSVAANAHTCEFEIALKGKLKKN